ncbi:hypothetical protein V8E55_007342, partial [Tylopilus felleus]
MYMHIYAPFYSLLVLRVLFSGAAALLNHSRYPQGFSSSHFLLFYPVIATYHCPHPTWTTSLRCRILALGNVLGLGLIFWHHST